MRRIWRLIGRGFAGWYAQGQYDQGPVCSSRGSLEEYVAEAEEGCYIYDASHLEGEAASRFMAFVVRGPLLNVGLAPNEMRAFNRKAALEMMGPSGMMGPGGLQGEFRTLALLGNLDEVGIEIYWDLLRKWVPGVKTGRIRRGTVYWDPFCDDQGES